MASTSTPPDWRSRKAQSEVAPKHRWQTSTTAQGPTRLPGQSRRRGIILGLLLLTGVALIGWYVNSLLIAPEQTPILVVSAGPYPEPFGPNAQSAEDAEAIGLLHDKTVRVTQTRSLQDFDRLLNSIAGPQSGAKTVVIVLSMHGGVNDNGEPCLIPPSASPRNPSSWIPLQTVLARIGKNLPPSTNKLLILDCNRIRMRWQQGTLYNAFTNRMLATKVVEDSDTPNLTVFNAVSPAQRSWASADLNATVFGHYLQRGLAGAADKTNEGGNGDRSVSLNELTGYVSHYVNQWAQHHRGESQMPLVLRTKATENDDYHVVWAVRGDLPARTPAEPAISDDKIDALWDRHDQLRDSGHYASNPRQWATLERKLLRLDETVAAGSAYEEQTRTLYGELNRLLTELEQTPAGSWAWLNGPKKTNAGDSQLRVHSLRWMTMLGRIDSQLAAATRDVWTAFEKKPSTDVLVGLLQHPLGKGLFQRDLVNGEWISLLLKYSEPRLWTTSAVGRVTANRRRLTELSVPADPRVFERLRTNLKSAADKQRLLEDRLFISGRNAGKDYTAQINAVRTALDDSENLKKDVASAWELQDRAWAEAPWLALWLSRPGTLMRTELRDESIAVQVAGLIAATHQLNKALRAGEPYSDEVKRVVDALEEISLHYDEECGTLGRMKPDAKADVLRRIEAALSVPLIPGRQRIAFRSKPLDLRRTLRKLKRNIAANLRSSYRETPRSKTNPDDNETQAEQLQDVRGALVRFVARWDDHPAVALLRPGRKPKSEPVTGDPGEIITKILARERELRRILDGYPGAVKSALASKPEEAKEYRKRFGDTARLLRTASALPLPFVQPDPVRHLQRFEIHLMLMWQAHRTCDDFWAGSAQKSRLYFERTADDYRNTASVVFPAMPPQESERITKRIAKLKIAAARGLRIDAESRLQLSPGEPLTVTAQVTADDSLKAVGEPATLSPLIFVTGPKRRVPGVAAADLKANAPASRLRLTETDLRAAGSPLNAVVAFRGHEFREAFATSRSGGLVVEWKPQTLGNPRITLSGDRQKPVSIVFVLDCSQSMSQKVAGGSKTRMDVAKEALVAMLDQLASRGNARVGVLFYGHRVGWDADGGKEILRRKNYPRKVPEGLLPLEDVETVLSLGRFNARLGAGVQRLLKDVQPWGETPLYLSLTEALSQFTGEPAGAEKRIIVITDGVNKQQVPTGVTLTKSQQGKVTSLNEVTAALKSEMVPAYLLGFEMSSAETQAATGDFRSIATASGGQFLSALNAKTLLPSLKSLFGPDRFSVTAGSSKPQQSPLGKTVTVQSGEVQIQSGNAVLKIELKGGEHLRLRLSADGRSIRSESYLVGSPKFVAMVDTKTKAPTGVKAGVHAATRSAGGASVTFPVSLQRDDGGVASRPGAYWIAITPMNEKREAVGPAYPFFDSRFAVSAPIPPVPVMLATVTGWPKNATHASVQVYAQPAPVTPAQRIGVKQLMEASTPTTIGDSRIRADISTPNGGTRLRVVQRTVSDATVLSPVKIDLSGKSPTRIVRRFDSTNGVAIHEFYFAGDQTAALPTRELLITPRSRYESGGRRTQRAVIVPVPSRGAVLRLNAPTPSKN